MKNGKFDLKTFLNNIELYLATLCFIVLTVMLQQLVYIVIPISLLLTVIRLIQDTIKLAKESEENLGASKPSMDLDACEREWNAKKAAMNEKGGTK